jgi:hypothetical protein
MHLRSHPRDPSPRVAIGVGIVLCAAATASVLPVLQPNTWIFRDGRFYVNVATTIVEDLTLDQHAFASSWYSGTLGWNRDLDPGWSNVALGARGEYWPKHPWIHPLIVSPLYFAFGLPATLGWNLLLFSLIGAGLYRFARAYARPAPAGVAAATFVLGTAIVQSAYDFSVDVLMLACFAQGLAAVLDGKGVRAGVLVALAVIIKPTALMLLPSLVLFSLERGDRRELGRSLRSGSIALLVYAGINTWMYGRPWWSGYNRTLVTRGGRPVVADHLDAFSVPFAEGFARMWSGPYGLVHAFTVLVIGVPGLLSLIRRRPRYAIGAVLGVTASLLVFAKYAYEGHRFHWPALALLVPGIAVSFELAGGALTRLSARRPFGPRFAGPIAALAALAASLAVLPFGAPLTERVRAGGPGAAALLERAQEVGAFGLALAPSGAALLVIVVHLAFAGVLISRLVRILERVVPPAIAGAAVAGLAMLPDVRDAVIAGGPSAILLALAAFAAERALERRAAAAALAAVLGVSAWALLPSRPGAPDSAVALLLTSLDVRMGIRLLAPFALLAVVGVPIALARQWRVGLALAALAALAALPGIGAVSGHWLAVSALPLGAPAAPAIDALARLLARAVRGLDARRTAIALAATLAVLLAIGVVRRAIAAGEPFHAATEHWIRRAVVHHGEVPCDFLAWEHLSWECSHFDAGLYGMVGLAVSEGIRVGGERRALMIVPTGRAGQERRVRWERVRAGRTLRVRWAVPDGLRGEGVLEIRAGGRTLAAIEVPPSGDGRVHGRALETAELAGSEVTLEVRMRPAEGRRHQATVALDLIWE